jgi:tetratricopeptide (TPR) repeat protein
LFCTVPSISQPRTIYEQAAAYVQNGQAAEAIPLLENRLQQAPEDLRALTLMGMALSAKSRPEDANRYFRQALRVNSSFAPALKNLAANEMALGSFDIARTHFQRLADLTPSDPGARLGLAQACIELGRIDEAFAILEKTPREAPAPAHFSAGELLARIQRYASAAREFELAQDGYPQPYDAGFNLVLAYLKAGQHANAVRVGEQLLARGFKQAELYNVLAQAYEAGGKTIDAYGALRTATTIDPKDPTNYLDLIALCLTHKNYDLALEIAGISIARIPASDRLHLQRGIVLAMKEDFPSAAAEFQTSIKLAPDKSIARVSLALMMLQGDRPAEATTILRERVQSKPDYLSLWFLGESLNRQGAASGSPEEQEAIGALTRSVQMNPDVAPSRILLAKLLAHRGGLNEAEEHLTRALALDPDNVTATYQLAQICQKKGDSERARQLFAKVSKAKADEREQFTRGGLQHIIRADSQ